MAGESPGRARVYPEADCMLTTGRRVHWEEGQGGECVSHRPLLERKQRSVLPRKDHNSREARKALKTPAGVHAKEVQGRSLRPRPEGQAQGRAPAPGQAVHRHESRGLCAETGCAERTAQAAGEVTKAPPRPGWGSTGAEGLDSLHSGQRPRRVKATTDSPARGREGFPKCQQPRPTKRPETSC